MNVNLRGERIADLRHFLQVTQGELASSIDIASSYISKLEKGDRELTDDIATRLASRHSLPISFFTSIDPISNNAAPTFRRKASTSVRESNYVNVLQKMAMRLFHQVSVASDYITWQDPLSGSTASPEDAAAITRRHFGLTDDEPVRNVVRLLERNGAGVVSSLAPGSGPSIVEKHHGVTRPDGSDNRPLVALFDTGRGDVDRFTAAHELGHLIHDRRPDEGISASDKEARAFRFAGAFLLPPKVVKDWIRPSLPLSGYLAIKSQYGVSVAASIRRGKDLGLIDPDRYRSLMIQISSRGWRTNEPGEVMAESPVLLGQAISRAHPTTPIQSASIESGIPIELISHWIGDTLPHQQPQEARNSNVIDFASARSTLRATSS